jgi:hypothetical protein
MNRRAVAAQLVAALGSVALGGGTAVAARSRIDERDTYSSAELLDSGHRFFGNVSRGLGSVIEEAGRRWGEPSGYILGQEGSGAFIGGLRYGEGRIYTRRGPGTRLFWQGPSLGFDFGGDGARTMMLVYNLSSVAEIYKRFIEINGSAYLVAGVGLTAAQADDTVVVPIRTGLGLRLGVNVGYMKFTDAPTWNPF